MLRKSMNRTSLIAATLVAALAFTPMTATPARADMSDATKLILGAVAVGALVTALERKNRREAARAPVRNFDVRRQALPAACAFQVRGQRGGWSDVYGRRCLERAGYRTLPAACAFDVRTNQGRTTVYGERCLRDRGYRVEARRR